MNQKKKKDRKDYFKNGCDISIVVEKENQRIILLVENCKKRRTHSSLGKT